MHREDKGRDKEGGEREPPTRSGARYIWNPNEAMTKPHRHTDQIPERVSLLTQSLSYSNMLYHLFTLLELSCNGQLMSQNMHMSPRSSSLHDLETIKTTMHRLHSISTAATNDFASTSQHKLHLPNNMEQRRMKTRKTTMNQTLKSFMPLIIIPKLTHL